MGFTRPSWATNTIQALANRVTGQAPAVKQAFDKTSSDIKTYLTNTFLPELEQSIAFPETLQGELIASRTNSDSTPITYSDLKARLDTERQEFLSFVKDNPIFLTDYCILDGSSDDSTNFETAIAAAISQNRSLYLPQNKVLKIARDVNAFGVKSIRFDGTVESTDLTQRTITIGFSSSNPLQTNYHLNYLNNIKLKIQGVKNSRIQVNQCPHVLLYAHGDQTQYSSISRNEIRLGNINKLEFFSEGTAIGWINENSFFGGDFDEILIDGNYAHNHNHFYKPLIENTTINIVKGSFNHFHDCRFEATNTVIFGTSANCNLIERGWYSTADAYYRRSLGMTVTMGDQSISASITDNGKGNAVVMTADQYHEFETLLSITPTSNNFNVDNYVKDANGITSKALSKRIFETDIFPITEDIGIFVKSDVEMWRIKLSIYDEYLNPITTEPTDFTNMVGQTFNTAGYYVFSSDFRTKGIPMFANKGVANVKIEVYNGSNNTFKKLFIYKMELKGSVTDVRIKNDIKRLNGTAIPTSGTWNIGDTVWNNNPISGAYIGWVCVASGTPGTWKGFGLIA